MPDRSEEMLRSATFQALSPATGFAGRGPSKKR